MMVFGLQAAKTLLEAWLADKARVVLVTGRRSYTACGAEAWMAPSLAGRQILHVTTAGENARKEDVEDLRAQVKMTFADVPVEGYIAIGGGTAIDTTKLLRAGFPLELAPTNIPFLAIPTTAGTGAEATRFAVYYDNGKKCSADNLAYLPTDQILVPEFCRSASPYQRAACAFDAYAQAVESLWAKGAADESRQYAQKALALMDVGEQMLGSYWAGRAIDISRTTAAHAFSYYMTATYGVPHGEAVYMMFPYVCRANGHEEFVREIPELRTLKAFAEEKGLVWCELIDNLFNNVNPARLNNNPCEVRKDHFNG